MIKNKTELCKGSALRSDALKIIEAGISAANPAIAMRNWVKLRRSKLWVGKKSYDLDKFDNIYIVGAGKASGVMAQTLEDILDKKVTKGLVNVNSVRRAKTRIIEMNEAGHPIPDVSTLKGTKKILKILREVGERDLVFVLISGGGSALLEMPVDDISLEDLKKTDELLLKCGANIDEINTVRKHISVVKGGKLIKSIPAQVISLILSDVVGDKLDVIASGPTTPDSTTFSDAFRVLEKYALLSTVPKSVLTYIKKGARGLVAENPKPENEIFKRVNNLIIGGGETVVKAAREKAAELGYNPIIISTTVEGESKVVGEKHASMLKKMPAAKKPAALISGGETTVTVRGKGKGGPNQEFVLGALLTLQKMKNFAIAAIDTDGEDGSTDAAGAIGDDKTLPQAEKIGLNPKKELEKNNSYHFFEKVGNLIHTGPTGTNVNDLRIMLIK
jgi:glycerate-2-kinase